MFSKRGPPSGVIDQSHRYSFRLAHLLQVAEVVTDDARDSVALPNAKLALVLEQERFGEAAEPKQRVDIALRRRSIQLHERERVKAEVTVAVRQGIAAFSIVVEACADSPFYS